MLHDVLCTSMPMATVCTSKSMTTLEAFPSSSSDSRIVSTRIERLMQSKNEFVVPLDFEIEASKDHWSQTVEITSASQQEIEMNLHIFESLKKKWGNFFQDQDDVLLVVGEKIAEGGQAEIFNGVRTYKWGKKEEIVMKVFKKGSSLENLQKQWPHGMLERTRRNGKYVNIFYTCELYGATLLKNGRFAFWMDKYWGDLRKLIDYNMQQNGNRSPPFKGKDVGRIIFEIALGMGALHEDNIVHRDLKASNVLIGPSYINYKSKNYDLNHDSFRCDVADFECSVGVVGTRFWRAPEILQAVKNRDIQPYLFTKESDVYSYGMTCYEVLTGLIPFEELCRNDYDAILEGRRPILPNQISPSFRKLLNACWHLDPSKRPSFEEILSYLKTKFMYVPHLSIH